MKFKTFEEYINQIKSLIPDKQALKDFYYYKNLQNAKTEKAVLNLRLNSEKTIVDLLTDEEIKYISENNNVLLNLVICIDDIYSAIEQERNDVVLQILIENYLRADTRNQEIILKAEKPKLREEKALKLIQCILKISYIHLTLPVCYLLELIDPEFLSTSPHVPVQPFVNHILNYFKFFESSLKPYQKELKGVKALATNSNVKTSWFLNVSKFVNIDRLIYAGTYFFKFITSSLTEDDIKTINARKSQLSSTTKQILLLYPKLHKYPKLMAACVSAFIKAKNKIVTFNAKKDTHLRIPDEVIALLSPEDCFRLLDFIYRKPEVQIQVDVKKLYEKACITGITNPVIADNLKSIHNIIESKEGYTTYSVFKKLVEVLDKKTGLEKFKILKMLLDKTLAFPSEQMINLVNGIISSPKAFIMESLTPIEVEQRFGKIKGLIKEIVDDIDFTSN